MKNRFMSLWAINDVLDLEKMKRQLTDMRKCGLCGVIFHPRYYPGVPEYMSHEYLDILSQLILYAKEIKMEFWLYDENGWPSGNADGQVMKQNPLLRKVYVELREKRKTLQSKELVYTCQRNEMACEETVLVSEDKFDLVLVKEAAPSSVDKEAVKLFVELTHEKYKKGLSPEAFDYITGFFSDEVCLPHAPEKYRVSSVPYIGSEWNYKELFFDTGDYENTRIHFWEKASELLAENFYKTINDWCVHNHKLYTAHLKGEENPAFSIPFNGSPFRVLKEVMLPCVDALERNVPNSYYPRIASSLAVQYGSGVCMCEALGGSGWGIEPEQLKRYLAHLTDCGIDTFALHIQQLKLDKNSKKDWPPSQPLDLSWRDAYDAVLNCVPESKKQADTLVIVPIRGVSAVYSACEREQTNIHNGTHQPRTRATALSSDFMEMTAGLKQFHVIDEKLFEQACEVQPIDEKSSREICQIGNMQYKTVVIHKGCRFNKKVQQTTYQIAMPETNVVIVPDGVDEAGKIKWGHFLVKSTTGWKDLGDTMSSEDFFELVSGWTGKKEVDASNLTELGFPFVKSPIVLEKEFLLERACNSPRYFFEQFNADCAKVFVDDVDMGFYWNGRENVWKTKLNAGKHQLKVILYPSSFNFFGPHNHIDGDVKICSPVQFTGEKNFADRYDAPDNTRSDRIHVKKFGIGDLIIL